MSKASKEFREPKDLWEKYLQLFIAKERAEDTLKRAKEDALYAEKEFADVSSELKESAGDCTYHFVTKDNRILKVTCDNITILQIDGRANE